MYAIKLQNIDLLPPLLEFFFCKVFVIANKFNKFNEFSTTKSYMYIYIDAQCEYDQFKKNLQRLIVQF